MAFSEQDMRRALIRSRAKKFANHLRTERWAESIPDQDIADFTDDEINTWYKMTLRQHGCRQRPLDWKWEAI